jgi:hypothetical protein
MGTVKTVRYSKVGDIKISDHFKLHEIRCKDKSDIVKYCDDTLAMAEKLRGLTECKSVIVISGYRTPTYNKKIAGSKKSSHCDGYALDLHFKDSKYSVKEICCMAQDLGIHGIGYISSTAIHIDMKPRKVFYRGDERKDYSNNVSGDFYTYFKIEKGSLPTSKEIKTSYTGKYPTIIIGSLKKGSKGNNVKLLQKFLNWALNSKLTTDGQFGTNTEKAVKEFQKLVGITQDGKFGKTSLKKAKEFKK